MVPELPSAMDRFIGHFGPFFPFSPTNNPKNQNFEKIKKKNRYIIILHMCTINDNHMIIMIVIMDNFLPYYPLKT